MVFSMSATICNATASQTLRTEHFVVGKNQEWKSLKSLNRTKKYNNTRIRVISVTPIENKKDNYTKVQAMAVDAKTGKAITSVKVFEEGTGFKSLPIKNGFLNTSKIVFKYRGNNYKYGAYVHATSDAR